MAFFTKSQARQFARQTRTRRAYLTADVILNESERTHHTGKTYDVFLSHASQDAEIVLGVKEFLEQRGLRVYVDWLEDTHLNRSKVTPETADTLRQRMRACTSFLFIASNGAPESKWMPWELGYFDGFRNGGIAIFPVLEDWETKFEGQEYLGLYPLVEELNAPTVRGFYVKKTRSGHKADLQQFAKGRHTLY